MKNPVPWREPWKLRDGLVISLHVYQLPAVETLKKWIEGVQFQCSVNLRVPFVHAFHGDQKVGIHEMAIGAVRVEFDATPKLMLGGGPVVIVETLNVGESDVGFGK